jgi:integrase
MKKHLTDLSIQKLRTPKSGQQEIFDLGYSGLCLRLSYGGVKSFAMFYRFNGKLRRTTIGRWPAISLADARQEWRRARESIAAGVDPEAGNSKAPALVFEAVVQDWLKRDQGQNRASSLYQVTRAIECDVLPAWSGRRVDTIGKRDVLELLDSIVDRGAPVKARRVSAYIHRFFSWCIERDILQANPMAGLSRPGNSKSRERVLADDELVKVWNASSIGRYRDVIRLLILTGMRREEAAQLRWSEVDGDCIKLEGARTKTGVPHIIPLSTQAKSLLESLPQIGDYVFTVTGSKPIAGWSRPKRELDKASGVTGWTIHDLRRTVATGMQKLGVTLQTVETCLGHTAGSRGGIVGVYQRHDYATEKRIALERWGQHVCNLIEGKLSTPNVVPLAVPMRTT